MDPTSSRGGQNHDPLGHDIKPKDGKLDDGGIPVESSDKSKEAAVTSGVLKTVKETPVKKADLEKKNITVNPDVETAEEVDDVFKETVLGFKQSDGHDPFDDTGTVTDEDIEALLGFSLDSMLNLGDDPINVEVAESGEHFVKEEQSKGDEFGEKSMDVQDGAVSDTGYKESESLEDNTKVERSVLSRRSNAVGRAHQSSYVDSVVKIFRNEDCISTSFAINFFGDAIKSTILKNADLKSSSALLVQDDGGNKVILVPSGPLSDKSDRLREYANEQGFGFMELETSKWTACIRHADILSKFSNKEYLDSMIEVNFDGGIVRQNNIHDFQGSKPASAFLITDKSGEMSLVVKQGGSEKTRQAMSDYATLNGYNLIELDNDVWDRCIALVTMHVDSEKKKKQIEKEKISIGDITPKQISQLPTKKKNDNIEEEETSLRSSVILDSNLPEIDGQALTKEQITKEEIKKEEEEADKRRNIDLKKEVRKQERKDVDIKNEVKSKENRFKNYNKPIDK